ncbi:MAG: hypothetical protein LBU15_03530, partial [Rickettsiales bacterium]|nr:hypothetical protein [Rickettsiales bacterium]
MYGEEKKSFGLTIDNLPYKGVLTKDENSNSWRGTMQYETDTFGSLQIEEGNVVGNDSKLYRVKLKTSRGKSYAGDVNDDGKFSGQGRQDFPGGYYEDGQFENGSFSSGRVRRANFDDSNSTYEGDWIKVKGYEGRGTITSPYGCRTEGIFENGKATNVVLEKELPGGKSTFIHILYDEDENVLLRQELEKEPGCDNMWATLDFSTLEKPKEPRMAVPTTPEDNENSGEEVEGGETKITYADDSVYVGKVDKDGK